MFKLHYDGIQEFEYIDVFQSRMHLHLFVNGFPFFLSGFVSQMNNFACSDTMVFNIDSTEATVGDHRIKTKEMALSQGLTFKNPRLQSVARVDSLKERIRLKAYYNPPCVPTPLSYQAY